MGSQYPLVNNDSSETITVKFEHCGAIWIRIEDTKDLSHKISIRLYSRFLTTIKMAHLVGIDKIKSFMTHKLYLQLSMESMQIGTKLEHKIPKVSKFFTEKGFLC